METTTTFVETYNGTQIDRNEALYCEEFVASTLVMIWINDPLSALMY